MKGKLITKIDKLLEGELKDLKYNKLDDYEDRVIYILGEISIDIKITRYNETLGIAYLNISVYTNTEFLYQDIHDYYLDKGDKLLKEKFKDLIKNYYKEENNMDASERIQEELADALLEQSRKEDNETELDLAKQYIECEGEISKIQLDIEQFKLKHSEIFSQLEEYEEKIKQKEEEKTLLKTKLLSKMVENFEYLGYSFAKVITEIKRSFDSKSFYKDYEPTSRLYKKYVTETQVNPYVKVTKLKPKKK